MSSDSRDAPARILRSHLPAVLILGLILCTAVAVPASAAAVIQKSTPFPNSYHPVKGKTSSWNFFVNCLKANP